MVFFLFLLGLSERTRLTELVKHRRELLGIGRVPRIKTTLHIDTCLAHRDKYGFTVYAADLWSDPAENRAFFRSLGLPDRQVIPVKADAADLPFARDFFDGVVSVDSYNYFGRDPDYLDQKLLPFVKPGGYLYFAIPGMKRDCHDRLPAELLLSWTPEQLDYMHDAAYWAAMVGQCKGADVLAVEEMESNEEVWADWLAQENEYAVGDRKAMEAGGGKYLNFIKIVLRKR